MRLPARAHCVFQIALIIVLATSAGAQEQDLCREGVYRSFCNLRKVS